MRMLANNQCLETSQIWIFCRSSKRVWQRVLEIKMMTGISILVCGPREFLRMKDKFWHSSSNPNIFVFRSLPSGTHPRIQIPNPSTLQMLPVAAQGI